MKRFNKIFLVIFFAILVFAGLSRTTQGAKITPQYLQRIGTALVALTTGDTLGDASNRWAGIYADDINTTTITIGGAIGGPIVYNPSSDQSLAAGDTLTVTNGIMRVTGSGGAVTLTSTPHITDATDGTCVIIQGTHNTNTLTLQDEAQLANSGMQLAGAADCTLGQGDTLQVCYDSGDDNWYSISECNNN